MATEIRKHVWVDISREISGLTICYDCGKTRTFENWDDDDCEGQMMFDKLHDFDTAFTQTDEEEG